MWLSRTRRWVVRASAGSSDWVEKSGCSSHASTNASTPPLMIRSAHFTSAAARFFFSIADSIPAWQPIRVARAKKLGWRVSSPSATRAPIE